MTVARLPRVSLRSERLLTIEDIACLPSELPSGSVRYELHNGRLVILAPFGDIHGAVESNIATELKIQGERRGLGKARSGQVGIVMWRDPDHCVGADAVFIALHALPIRLSKEGYLETIPDLVVEVRSKNDTQKEIDDKIRDYLKVGVRVVWVADPDKKTVTEYRPRRKPRVYGIKDTLTIEDVIPGFQMPVPDVFVV